MAAAGSSSNFGDALADGAGTATFGVAVGMGVNLGAAGLGDGAAAGAPHAAIMELASRIAAALMSEGHRKSWTAPFSRSAPHRVRR